MPSSRRGVPKQDPDATKVYLRRNTKLIRRSALRKILMGRYHANGLSSLEAIQAELKAASGIHAHIQTLSVDLREMGAIKVRDAERTSVEWWVLPAYNPNAEDLREQMDQNLVESEVAHKIASHVIDLSPVNNFVYVLTESRAGYLVGYWLSWLTWPEVIAVVEQPDMCIVHCLNDLAAINTASRLVGDARLESGGDDAVREDGDDS